MVARIFFLSLLVLVCLVIVANAEDEPISTAALNPNAIPLQLPGITPLGKGSDGETCFMVDRQLIHQLEDGSIYLDVFDPVFDIVTVVLGVDRRNLADIIFGETEYRVCIKMDVGHNEYGMPIPILTRGYFVPPDMSS